MVKAGRDYPIMFGTLFFFTLLGLIINLISDLLYVAIDPRIDFESREVAAAALDEEPGGDKTSGEDQGGKFR